MTKLLTHQDELILGAALRERGGFHVATNWLFGWDPLDYQYFWHHIPILNTTFLAGIGSGKTSNVAASYSMDCLTLPGFRALNASVTAKQAELAYEMVDAWAENNPRFKRLIVDRTLRPYPILQFFNHSTYEFRTAGQGAKFIRGHEYDRINYDEGELDPDGEAVKVLRGRLRGSRPDGSPRMARLDVTGTPAQVPWFRERFEKGLPGHPNATAETLKHYLSMRVTTYMNTKLTREQIELMEAEFPAEYARVELGAEFPDYGLSTFPHNHILACIDPSLNDEVTEALYERSQPFAGYSLEEWPHVGTVHMEFPVQPQHVYVIAGDPGMGNPPHRNAGCVMVFDVTTPVSQLAYFEWIAGKGSYHPFMNSYKYAMEKYATVYNSIDVTGTQRALDELGFEDFGLVLDGLSFGGLKDTLINSLSMAFASHTLRLPRIEGLLKQSTEYIRENDTPSAQIAQDLVMTLAQITYCRRFVNADSVAQRARRNLYARRPRNLRTITRARAH
jgi:hypothetical protein